MIEPIKCLNKELHDLERSLDKSADAYAKSKITLKEHMSHSLNLEPKIESFKEAIEILKQRLR